MEEEKRQDVVKVQSETLPQQCNEPVSRQCDNRLCKDAIVRLQKECDDLREENHRLRQKLWTFEEHALENDDEKVKALTGLPTYVKLQVVLSCVLPFLTIGSNLSPFQQLLLTLMRMKMNLSLSLLSVLFNISITTASRTFRATLEVLHSKLLPTLVFWPDRVELRLSMSMMFRQTFSRCACIIDCIFIEKPKDLKASAQTYSNYKHHHTMKYLIGITQQGTVCFISKGWGGRTSDKHVTEQCGFLNNLNPGDVIFADRGFDVADFVGMFNAELKIPAFTRGKKQLSPEELESLRGLASVRIHVERVIGETKNRYTILQSTIG